MTLGFVTERLTGLIAAQAQAFEANRPQDAAPRIEETTVRIGDTEEDTRMASTRLVRGINLLGEPALSLPCGKTAAALPIGLQLISAPFTESQLLQIARTLERALN